MGSLCGIDSGGEFSKKENLEEGKSSGGWNVLAIVSKGKDPTGKSYEVQVYKKGCLVNNQITYMGQ